MGRSLRILVLAVATAYGALPTQVCIPHGEGRGGVHWMGGHSHGPSHGEASHVSCRHAACSCGHRHHPEPSAPGPSCPEPSCPEDVPRQGHDEGCCSDSPFDLRAPGTAVALAPPGIGAAMALASAAAVVSVEEVAPEGDPGERERRSVVLIR